MRHETDHPSLVTRHSSPVCGKRLLKHAQRCAVQPAELAERWNYISRLSVDDGALADLLEELIDDLFRLIEADQ